MEKNEDSTTDDKRKEVTLSTYVGSSVEDDLATRKKIVCRECRHERRGSRHLVTS
jgi:hypothetical protein